MFNGDRYITRGIQAAIGIDIQMAMWMMIDELKNKNNFNLDYLQVFTINKVNSKGSTIVSIKHEQEVEPYLKEITIPTEYPIDRKVFVISSHYEDGKEYSTMMLSDEY
ncbi:MAG: DUF960 family protein [Tissierellaceae bacterium]|nr:DUF960 family protein [Tissierellaceae bacterium]